MDRIKSPVGRRQFLTIAGAASALAVTPGTSKAAEKAIASGCGANTSRTIKGVVVEKPAHLPYSFEQSIAARAAERSATAGGPSGGFGTPGKATPAIYIEDGKVSSGNSKAEAVSAGKVGDAFASGVKISAKDADIGGVYAKGLGTEYVLANATIDLSGDAGTGLGGPNSGASADDYASLTIRNCTITTRGKARNATSVRNHGLLRVYNSTLTAHGVPFDIDITNTNQKKQLEIDGNSRAHVTLSNSLSYFYYSTIIAEGWAALSTDGAEGFLYLEANHCNVRTVKSGYGTYADKFCHNCINDCDFDVASMAAILEGESDVTFNNTRAKCGTYFALIHSIGTPAELSTLRVTGGEITCKSPAVLVKSANADIAFDGVKMASESGVLLKSTISVDPQAAKAANTKGQKVYGIHATFKNMDVAGDIDHSMDKDNRGMTVYLEQTTLKGAIKDASIKLNRLSKWTATTDSNVTIIGDVEISQIDAPAGVTITAVASQSGTYKLASCGTLILKT